MSSLPRIKTSQDWNNFIAANPQLDGTLLLAMRNQCYADIEAIRKRPLIVYATKFLDALPNTPNFIDISDVDGFTDLVQSTNGSEEIDVLLHSPGGRPDATERIVHILRNKFKRVHFLIPHSAYSAATMLALSGDSITLHPSATLGPIDPQINGTPARSIKRGFEKVKEIIKQEGPEALPA
jgi:ClpP class serine protease